MQDLSYLKVSVIISVFLTISIDFRFKIGGGNRNERCINNNCCSDWILKTKNIRGNNPFPRFIKISIILKIRLNRACKIHLFHNTQQLVVLLFSNDVKFTVEDIDVMFDKDDRVREVLKYF